jgi:hypothetical protein
MVTTTFLRELSGRGEKMEMERQRKNRDEKS